MSDLYCYFNSRCFGENRILDIFCKYNIAFGIAEENFDSLDNLNINFLEEEKELFEIGEWVLAVKVKLFRLEEKDFSNGYSITYYGKRKRIRYVWG